MRARVFGLVLLAAGRRVLRMPLTPLARLAGRRTRLGARCAVVLLVAPALSGCSGSPAPAPTTMSVVDRLAAVKAVVDATPSVHLVMISRDIPDGVGAVLGLDGVGTHPPAFKGTVSARMAGIMASVAVVAVGGVMHVKLPLTTTYQAVDPTTFGAPDPAVFFDPAKGVTTLLTATTGPVRGAQARVGSEIVTTYSGSLPGSVITGLLNVGSATAVYAVKFGVVEESSQLRTVELTGPFYAGATSTYVLTLDRYGDPVTITAP